ncbi:MAG: transcription elongation factor GreA [Firmicutes bacterium]|nr:transcription elongation factor GreA [Bacillota bacterium]MBQ7241712.1 transcription elongation factor GreA [Bacillota bacterium]MBR0104129.1 transcription elongation factor GreA [Bacillota bacterium]MBR2593643.1 transcription elongation factor GreA [Bacillota bacterium]
MSDKKTVLTYEGLRKIEEELEYLKVVKRKEIAERIKEARGQGDLSENAEYDAAREEQAKMETEILVLEKMLRNAEVIDDNEVSSDVITVGSTVKLFDEDFEEEVEYTIVGSAEADPVEGRISNESPVGRGLLGHKSGDTVVINAPQGEVIFKVLEISKQ